MDSYQYINQCSKLYCMSLNTIFKITCAKLNLKLNGFNSVKLSIVYTLRSHIDKGHLIFVVILPLNTAQSSQSAAPLGRGLGNIAHGCHAVTSSCVGDHCMRGMMKRLGV